MKKGHIQYRALKRFYRSAARNMCKDFKAYISLEDKVLDLGCGSGITSKQIETNFKADVLGIDVIDLRVEDVSFKKYNGEDLSFLKDNEFDVTLISYVLHHTKDAEKILKQVKRVTKKYIIIYEDLNEGFLGKIYCKIHGRAFAKFFQKNEETGKFFTEEEWKQKLSKLGLEIVEIKNKPYFLNPVKRKIFIVKTGVCSSAG